MKRWRHNMENTVKTWTQLNCLVNEKLQSETMGAYFNSSRKGPVVCRGLDIDLSGKVAKNVSHMEKRSRHPQCYRCVQNLSPSMANAAATAYTHINVAIVKRSHFGNAKPKLHMNSWPTISINDRSCQQHCRAGHIFIYIHYIQKYWQPAEECTHVQLSLRTVKHIAQK